MSDKEREKGIYKAWRWLFFNNVYVAIGDFGQNSLSSLKPDLRLIYNK